MRTAVVGHVEWVEFTRVSRVPLRGEIAHGRASFEEPAGGGAVAAVQLARLGGDCTLFTALGEDELAIRVRRRLAELGVRVEAVVRRDESTRRAFTFLDDGGERTITTLGERLAPRRSDDLPWGELVDAQAIYFVAGDVDGLRAARQATQLVATTRVMDTLASAGVPLDAVVGSGHDASERYRPIEPPPRFVVTTDGAAGGNWSGADGSSGGWKASPLPGPVVDAYGCGDSFAAGLTFALAKGFEIDGAVELAARCGALCMSGRGPYGRRLSPEGRPSAESA